MANYVTGIRPPDSGLYITKQRFLQDLDVRQALNAKMRVHVHTDFVIPKGMTKIWHSVTTYNHVEFEPSDKIYWLDQRGDWYEIVYVPLYEASKHFLKEHGLEHELQIWPDFMVSLNPYHEGDRDYMVLPSGIKLTILVRSRISKEAQDSLMRSSGNYIKMLFTDWLDRRKAPTPIAINWNHVFS